MSAAPSSTLLPPADNPFLENDLARYIPHAKAETWRLSATRSIREKAVKEPKALDLEVVETLLPVVQHPMIVVANGRVVEALLPEKSILEKLGFSVAADVADDTRMMGGRHTDDIRMTSGWRGDVGGTMPVLGQVGLVWGKAGRDVVRFAVEAGMEVTVHVVQVAGGDGAPVSAPLEIDVAADGKLTLVEHWVGEAAATCWLNAARVVRVEAGGSLTHGLVQTLPVGALLTLSQDVRVGQGATYVFEAVQAGAGFARLESEIVAARDVDIHVRALQLTDAEQVHDVTTRVRLTDIAPKANVRQRNIVKGGGTAVFQGKYHVEQAAQKTDAYMLCENLLLDDKAVVNQKPELEIYADDVKCSHGASTGSLRDEQLFYLQARGLDAAAARRLLVAAYAEATVNDMDPVIAAVARPLVHGWMER